MSEPKKFRVGRIALRHEAEWWVAYWDGDHKPKIELSRIRMHYAEEDAKIKEAFIALNRLVFESAAKASGNAVIEWGEPIEAPESERSGNA